MITLFATGKPFRDHSGVIQRNAIISWTRLHPDVEVILFGDEPGTAEIAQEFKLRHEPHVERNSFGTKRLDYMFARAQEIARNDIVCYINCDIILFPEVCDALAKVKKNHKNFMMVGRRWDTNVTESADFTQPQCAQDLLKMARGEGVQRDVDCVDYFAFPKGYFRDMPQLVVGRIWWDHWLVWKARQQGDVVDVSSLVTAIHQNHDYGYHPVGAKGVWEDEQAKKNYELAGGRWHLYTIADATHVFDQSGERANPRRFAAPYWRYLRPSVIPVWFAILGATRPLRKLLGLRRHEIGAGNQQKILHKNVRA